VVDVQAIERERVCARERGKHVEQDDRIDAPGEGEGQARAGRHVAAQLVADARRKIT
jgi:hypothetical protein